VSLNNTVSPRSITKSYSVGSSPSKSPSSGVVSSSSTVIVRLLLLVAVSLSSLSGQSRWICPFRLQCRHVLVSDLADSEDGFEPGLVPALAPGLAPALNRLGFVHFGSAVDSSATMTSSVSGSISSSASMIS
jgi:hypothetical protein